MLHTVPTCSYCGRPLRLVAGFCAACHAPAAVARHQRLVAASHAVAAPAAASAGASAQRPVIPRRNASSADRPLAIAGCCALALAIVVMAARATFPLARAPAVPGMLSLATGTGASLPSPVAVRTDVTIVYEVTVKSSGGAIVTLEVSAPGSHPGLLTERWPQGTQQRSISLAPLTPGIWRVTLIVDGASLAMDSFRVTAT